MTAHSRIRLTRSRVIPFSVPLASGGRREGWLLGVEGAGVTGWGEASPLAGFSVETTGDAGVALERVASRLEGRVIDPEDPGAILSCRGHGVDSRDAPLPHSVQFAVELALLNLASAATSVPVARLLEPRARDRCPVAALIAGPEDACRAGARRAATKGFRSVKLKVGRASPERDAALVRDVSGILGPEAGLRLDANRAWTMDQALEFADRIAGVPIEFIEEPLADPTRLPELAAASRLPVALDESLAAIDPDSLNAFDGLRALVLKPTMLGGIRAALRYAVRARALGITTVVSAAFETGVGLRGLAGLAASLPGVPVAAGLGTADWLSQDTTDPPFPRNEPDVETDGPYRVSPRSAPS